MQTGTCHGNGDQHCCWVDGAPCPFLEEHTVAGRRWACGLLREYRGNWKRVHSDARYVAQVRPRWIAAGVPDCGDWVGPGCCFGGDQGSITPEQRGVYEAAAQREGTPVHIRAHWGV